MHDQYLFVVYAWFTAAATCGSMQFNCLLGRFDGVCKSMVRTPTATLAKKIVSALDDDLPLAIECVDEPEHLRPQPYA